MRIRYIVAAAALTACGCGGSHSKWDGGSGDAGSGDGGSAPTMTPENVCAYFADTTCSLLVSCGYIDPSERQACISSQQSGCGVVPAKVHSGVNSFEQARAQACANALAQETGCDDRLYNLLLISNTCVLPFVLPDAGLGTSCQQGDCAAGYCPNSPGACTACTAYVPIGGAPCFFDHDICDPSTAYCNILLNDGGSDCEALLPPGAACQPLLFDCRSRVCSFLLATDGGNICGTAVGDACQTDQDCDPSGYYCKILPAQNQGSCEHFLSAGTPCGLDSTTGCTAPGVCFNGTCTVIPPMSVGPNGRCSASIDCQEGLYCNNASVTCVPQLDAGDACPQQEACPPFSTFCALNGSGTCVRLLGPGQSCSDSICRVFEDCANPDGGPAGTCLVNGQPGEWCSAQRNCSALDAFCSSPDGGSDGTCASLTDAGVPCDPNVFSCASGICGSYNGTYLCQPLCP